MTPKENLEQAWELISQPGRWTQGVLARTKEGRTAHYTEDKAHCFCAVGAVRKVAADANRVDFSAESDLAEELLDSAAVVLFKKHIPYANDKVSSVVELKPMFDLAIEYASRSI